VSAARACFALTLIAGYFGAALLVIFADDAAAEVPADQRGGIIPHSYSGRGVESGGRAASPRGDVSNRQRGDYRADSLRLSLSRELFDGMSLLSLDYSGGDRAGRDGGDNAGANTARRGWKLGLAQVLTSRALLNLDYEIVSERGLLADPYRDWQLIGDAAAHAADPAAVTGSHALAARSSYYLDDDHALFGGYRYLSGGRDTAAHDLDLGLRTPVIAGGNLEIYYQHYRQSTAGFEGSGFYREQSDMARGKEPYTLISNSLGVRADYQLFAGRFGLDHGQLRVGLEYSRYDYDDHHDGRRAAGDPAGDYYSFDAHIARFSFTGTF